MHDRTRQELIQLLGPDIERVRFVPDSWLDRLANRLTRRTGSKAAYLLGHVLFGTLSRISTQRKIRQEAKALIAVNTATVVH